jgi:protoporphyrin/coproporphyrin ferrochelatase
MHKYDAVLFISFGGPETQEDIMPFLEIVTRGRGIPRERLLGVAKHYEHIGGRSPINEITRIQAELLQKQLKAEGFPLPVYIGQRNWHPFIEDTLQKMIKNGVTHAIGFATAAHRSEASLERYIKAVEEARAKIGPKAPVIDYVDPWFDHPLFIEALAERVHEVVDPNPALKTAPWYFIAHSIPCVMAKDSTYVPELRRTAASVSTRFDRSDVKLAFSSRSGNPKEPWLVPDVGEVIRAEAKRGEKDILFITIGFLADHVEVLFDQDVEARAVAEEAGIRFCRTQTVGDHPFFIRMMADVIRKRMEVGEKSDQRDSSSTTYENGKLEPAIGRAAGACYCFPEDPHPPCVNWVTLQAQRPKPSVPHA